MLRKVIICGTTLAALMIPAVAQAQYNGQRDGNYYRDSSHYYYDGHHYRDRSNNAVIDTVIGGLLGYGLGVATSSGYNNGYAAPAYGYGQPAYGNGYAAPAYGYAQPAYGYSQVMVIPGYTYRDGYYWDRYGRSYDRDSMYRRYGHRHNRDRNRDNDQGDWNR